MCAHRCTPSLDAFRCGFNHGVGSGKDAKMVLMETDAGHTAYFYDMDPREVNNEDGDPRPNAVYRTNHGFDPFTISHYQWNGTGADADSRERYALFPQVFDGYDAYTYGLEDAVFTAAVAAGKTDDSHWVCNSTNDYASANNVISTAFQPSTGAEDNKGVIYAAWELGSGNEWIPAACGAYVKFDMSLWW